MEPDQAPDYSKEKEETDVDEYGVAEEEDL